MIKVFTTNKDGKIELTKDELKGLLDEAYREGYRANCSTYTYCTPNYTPYCWTTTTSGMSLTLNSTAETANNTVNASDNNSNTTQDAINYNNRDFGVCTNHG